MAKTYDLYDVYLARPKEGSWTRQACVHAVNADHAKQVVCKRFPAHCIVAGVVRRTFYEHPLKDLICTITPEEVHPSHHDFPSYKKILHYARRHPQPAEIKQPVKDLCKGGKQSKPVKPTKRETDLFGETLRGAPVRDSRHRGIRDR